VDRRIDVYVPNVFTPDGDGNNDWFTIYANPKHVLNIQTLQVFDRWGSKVFERSDFLPNLDNLGWDGMHRGTAENPAVFVWYAELELADGTVEVFKGDVTLTR
jgi:gliding motility-associated-like protein